MTEKTFWRWIIVGIVGSTLAIAAFWGTIAYVVVHFISKWW